MLQEIFISFDFFSQPQKRFYLLGGGIPGKTNRLCLTFNITCDKRIFYQSCRMKISAPAFSFFVIVVMAATTACGPGGTSSQTGEEFLREHIKWLSADERNGRLAGTVHEAGAANYISDRFREFGLEPAGDEGLYTQQFTLNGPMVEAMDMENHLARNVLGVVPGTDQPGQYIIVGAHYDGQGSGGIISMNENTEPVLHNSADDNASGTAGLLYLAEKAAGNPVGKSVLFIAFSGEEMGLLGSRHYIRNPGIEKDSVLAMINLDMIGRLSENELTVFGTGTANIWEDLLEETAHDSLSFTFTPSGTGASDHAAFYEEEIPVLHYFSGTHEDYHRPSDTADKINYKGMEWVLEHLERMIAELADTDISEIEFSETTDPRASTMHGDGVTMGVLPDYGYSGEGFRIEGVRDGNPAAMAGLQSGDVIIAMDEKEIADIYDYMESLNTFSRGDDVLVRIRRGEEVIELTVSF